nr:hypothetical protein CFP56_59086 [Quercus suber]
MWKPDGNMECIDLGFDFYLVKLSLADDVDKEPDFKVSTATLSSVAVWVRLPELPIEYYEHEILLKIGKVIGPVLRIDSNTAMGARGRFARLCVQVNLDKPLRKIVRIGHKKDACPFIIRENLKENTGEQEVGEGPNTVTQNAQEQKMEKADNYGDWMVVNRRRKANKFKGRMPVEEVSQTETSNQSQSNRAADRKPDTSQREGKRKASVVQSTEPIRVADKTGRSKDEAGRGLVTDSKSMVEVPLKPTSDTIVSEEQLRMVEPTSGRLPLEKLLTEAEAEWTQPVIGVRKILQDKPVECLMMGHLYRVKLIQFAEPKILGTILIKAIQELLGITKHSTTLFRGIMVSKREMMEA